MWLNWLHFSVTALPDTWHSHQPETEIEAMAEQWFCLKGEKEEEEGEAMT